MAGEEPVTLPVRLVGTDYDASEKVLTVGVAEKEDASGETLVFGRSFEPSEDDVALGQDTYSVSVASGRSTYGGIELAELLRPDVLYLRFSPTAQAELGINSRDVHLDLKVPERDIAELTQALRRIGVPLEPA